MTWLIYSRLTHLFDLIWEDVMFLFFRTLHKGKQKQTLPIAVQMGSAEYDTHKNEQTAEKFALSPWKI